MPDHDMIAVIDFGGQYAHLIATKVRRLGVLAEIRQPEDAIDIFRKYKGIIVSGSPALSSHGEDSDYTKEVYDLDVPMLGLCFGHQEIAKHYGGKVHHGGRQWGKAELHLTGEHPLFAGLGPVEQVWMSHYDSVVELGPEFEELGYTPGAEGSDPHRNAAIGSDSLRRYGFQFHAEVDDTTHGDQMLGNFLFGICGCTASWSMDNFLTEEMERIREQVGERSVFLLASGGVDSTVAAVLIGRAIGPDRIHLLHIDNGLMRKNESAQVVETFRELGLGDNLHFVDASETFLAELEGATDPEKKRLIIGQTFVDVAQEKARQLGIEKHLLGQGTIYPDTIEAGGTKRSDTIKTHHNRVPVIEEMIERGELIEPLTDLYKVEVRELGAKKTIPLAVSAPFHCSLMEPAAEKLAIELAGLHFKDASPPVVTNVEAEPNANAARMPELLRKQVTAPVRFTDMIAKMKLLGVDQFLEVGPGRVLSGLIARIERRARRANFSSLAELEGVRDFLVNQIEEAN